MPSTYTSNLNLEKPADGEQEGEWGTTINSNMELIDAAVSSAADDITTGDSAVSIATTSGNITIDAQGSDTDIILKGTDGSDDTIFLTVDGSDGGTASFSHDVKLANDGATLGFGSGNDVTLTHNHDSGLTLSAGANATQLTLTTTESGGAVAPTLNLIRASGSPAVNDQLGYLNFVGLAHDSASPPNATQTNYAQIFANIGQSFTTGSQYGTLDFYCMESGTLINALKLTAGDVSLPTDAAAIKFGVNSDVTLTHNHDSGLTLSAGANATALNLTSTDAGASVGPTINLIRDSANPAASDSLGYLNFVGEDDESNQTNYAQIIAVITDPEHTGPSEDGKLSFYTVTGGSNTLSLDLTGSTATFTNQIIAAELDISGNIDIDGTANLDVVDIDGAVDMASTLTLAGNADFNGDLDVDGTANLDVVDVDGAANFAADVTFADGADIITATAGTSNVRVGVNAGINIASGGNYNVLIGDEAGNDLTTGDFNIAVGYAALDAATTNSYNTAIGGLALTNANNAGGTSATANAAVGYNTLQALTTGSYNTGCGTQSLQSTTTAVSNVAAGYAAMLLNTTGSYNHAYGHASLYNCRTGYGNVAMGYLSAYTVDSGFYNVGIGYQSIYYATGSYNTGVGSFTLLNTAAGEHNTALGYQAGDVITSGSHNICIGSLTDTSANSGGNQIVIGYNITGGEDNQFTFGKASNVVQNEFDTDANWTRTSDRRKKRNIEDDTLGLEFINNLRTVTHQWKPSNEFPEEWDEYSEENTMNLDAVMHGMIAQEVKEALDKSGCDTFGGWDERSDGSQTVSREMFVIPLIKAVQELSAEVKELKEKLND